MKKEADRIAVSANVAAYDQSGTTNYVDAAPHIKHPTVRRLYHQLLSQIFELAARYSESPRVLDLGAGEGSVTLPFLQLGARVTAVDISQTQLDALGKKCAQFAERIELRCEDVAVALREERCYDIVSALSLLHHIPDYMSLVRQAIARLSPHGQFFSFQDPLRYDTVGAFTNAFSEISYLSWRVFKGDIWGGFTRRVRRSRGVYLPDCLYDNAEYHVTRNGVDQDALCNLSEKLGCSCTIVRYFSTQSGFFQPVGSALKLENTFAVIAQKAPV